MPRLRPTHPRDRASALRPAVLDLIARNQSDPSADEAWFLAELRAAVERTRTPAGDLLALYRGSPDGHAERYYASYTD